MSFKIPKKVIRKQSAFGLELKGALIFLSFMVVIVPLGLLIKLLSIQFMVMYFIVIVPFAYFVCRTDAKTGMINLQPIIDYIKWNNAPKYTELGWCNEDEKHIVRLASSKKTEGST